MIQIFKNKKRRKCDACSVNYDDNYNIEFGHNTNHQHIAVFCEGCLHDLKDKLLEIFSKKKNEKMN